MEKVLKRWIHVWNFNFNWTADNWKSFHEQLLSSTLQLCMHGKKEVCGIGVALRNLFRLFCLLLYFFIIIIAFTIMFKNNFDFQSTLRNHTWNIRYQVYKFLPLKESLQKYHCLMFPYWSRFRGGDTSENFASLKLMKLDFRKERKLRLCRVDMFSISVHSCS